MLGTNLSPAADEMLATLSSPADDVLVDVMSIIQLHDDDDVLQQLLAVHSRPASSGLN